MKKFNLSAQVTISIYTEVEANTLKEAIEIAQERSIEHSRWKDEEQRKRVWCSDEFDGEPCEIHEC
mgnify:CR=1 FL=1